MSVLVSVVVPTYHRPALLERCLAALVAQTFHPFGYEIIVADDGNNPVTRQQVAGWMRRGHPRIVYAPVHGTHGPAAARNTGWRRAAGRVIAFTDDDTIPRPDWLAQGYTALRDESVVAAAGCVRVPICRRRPSDYELDASRLADGEFVTANCFVRRRTLFAIGGFDQRFTAAWREDSDLFFSLLEAQGKVVRAPHAVVVHPVRPAGWGVSLTQQRKIVFDALLYKKHPALYRKKIRRAPPWNYYAIALCLALLLVAAATRSGGLALAAGAVWLALTVEFCARRLRKTSRSPRHVAEMVATSIAIPPVAVFWRLVGAVRFQVLFI